MLRVNRCSAGTHPKAPSRTGYKLLEVYPVSFETQERPWSCGLAALRYCCSLLGSGLRHNRELQEDDIRRRAAKSRWRVFRDGMSEEDLRRAGNRLGLRLRFHRFFERSPARVIDELRRATRRHHPCLVCVHDDSDAFFHWICVARFTRDWAIVFDPATLDEGEYSEATYWLADNSGNAAYSPGLMKISRLAAWIDTTEELSGEIENEHGGEHHLFIEVSVAPERRGRFVPGFPNEALVRRMRRHLDLARSFDRYIDDLRDIFGRPSWNRTKGRMPAHVLLERQRPSIHELFATWTLREYCSPADLKCELENLIAITRCYRFSVPRRGAAEAWRHLAFYLGWWAAEQSNEVGDFAG